MSRYGIAVSQDIGAIVGYDPPLKTYFGQVWTQGSSDDEERCLCWVGTAPDEIETVQQLEGVLYYCDDEKENYIVIPPHVRLQLLKEKETQAPLSALQQTMLEFLREHQPREKDK